MLRYVLADPPLLVYTDRAGETWAGRLHRWYAWRGSPLLAIATVAPTAPDPDVPDDLNAIRVAREALIILDGRHFLPPALQFEGCVEPLSQRRPEPPFFFPAPTGQGSLALMRRVLSLVGAPVPADPVEARCRVTGEVMYGIRDLPGGWL
jgi:hypothetical protein